MGNNIHQQAVGGLIEIEDLKAQLAALKGPSYVETLLTRVSYSAVVLGIALVILGVFGGSNGSL